MYEITNLNCALTSMKSEYYLVLEKSSVFKVTFYHFPIH